MNAPVHTRHLAPAAPHFELASHRDHQRIVHVTTDDRALTRFLDEVSYIDVQNLEYVPFMRFKIAQLLHKHLGHELATKLVSLVKDRQHGGFTIGLQGVSQNPDDYVKFGTAIAHTLGPANHDSMSGKFYA